MKEIMIYTLVALSSLTMLAYTVHMFVGGLVSEDTEHALMIAVVVLGATAMAFMAWDVVKRRSSQR